LARPDGHFNLAETRTFKTSLNSLIATHGQNGAKPSKRQLISGEMARIGAQHFFNK
jgi:hypothetical protein